MDDDDYPSEEDLEAIRSFQLTDAASYRRLAEMVVSLWWMADWGARLTRRGRLYLSTGGWSGNESVVEALRDQGKPLGFWGVCWEESRRGGHYVFQLPNPKTFDSKHGL